MRIDLISAVPDSFQSILSTSIVKIAIDKGALEIYVHDLHKYSEDKWGHIDDKPFGGGAGMLIKCKPIFDCVEELCTQRTYDEIIYTAPDATIYNQSTANELSLKENVIIICGHYKGIDQRIRDVLVTREISIGDFVLSGGELPALIIVDSVARILPKVIGNMESALEDSFMNGLLEAPNYTRPADFRGHIVPEVLLSGNHAQIEKWKHEQAIEKTNRLRPELLQ